MADYKVTKDLPFFVNEIIRAAHLPRQRRGSLNSVTIEGNAEALPSQGEERRYRFSALFISEIRGQDNQFQEGWKYVTCALDEEPFDATRMVESNLKYIESRLTGEEGIAPQLHSYFQDGKLVVDSAFHLLRDPA